MEGCVELVCSKHSISLLISLGSLLRRKSDFRSSLKDGHREHVDEMGVWWEASSEWEGIVSKSVVYGKASGISELCNVRW